VTDPGFKSWNIDASPNRQWNVRDLSDRTLRSLARQSLPGYLRFGGGGNDGLRYALDMSDPSSAGNACAHGATRCLNRTWFDNLHGFAEAAGAGLVFGLSMTAAHWNSTDARALISYAIATNKTFFGFELGNEQCKKFTAAETAANFVALSTLLAELYPRSDTRPKILGPDPFGFHAPFDEGGAGEGERAGAGDGALSPAQRLAYLVDFAGNCSKLGVPLHAITHHEYIEVPPHPAAPANSTILDYTAAIAAVVNRTLAERAPPGAQVWAGEVGPHNGGSPGCREGGSARWANWGNTFWYLDAMASKAANGYRSASTLIC
jgi:hypothetical protein